MRRPEDWHKYVNEPQTEAEVKCVQRGRPFGTASWMAKAAKELGLESSLRPRGRPKKSRAGASLFDDPEQADGEEEK